MINGSMVYLDPRISYLVSTDQTVSLVTRSLASLVLLNFVIRTIANTSVMKNYTFVIFTVTCLAIQNGLSMPDRQDMLDRMEKMKDKVVDRAQEAYENAQENLRRAQEAAAKAVESAQEVASRVVENVKESANAAAESADEAASRAVEAAKVAVHDAMESAQQAKQYAKETIAGFSNQTIYENTTQQPE